LSVSVFVGAAFFGSGSVGFLVGLFFGSVLVAATVAFFVLWWLHRRRLRW
jgi:hypothetical protein